MRIPGHIDGPGALKLADLPVSLSFSRFCAQMVRVIFSSVFLRTLEDHECHRELKRGLCTTENTAPADHEVDVLLGLDLAAEHLLMRIARRQKLEVLEIAGEQNVTTSTRTTSHLQAMREIPIS